MAINWKKALEITERLPLTTKAVDQKGRTYDVELHKQGGHWVVALLGTPGSWRLASVADDSAVAIDFGSGWAWTNVRPVVAEAKAILEPKAAHARKKTKAQLDREIDEALTRADRGDRVLADLTRWGVDRELVGEVRAAFRAGDHRRAMTLARDLGWNRASKRGRAFR